MKTKNPKIRPWLEELKSVILSFFSRKGNKQGKMDLMAHIENTLREIPNMLPTLKEYPHLGAMGFLGKIRFEDSPETEILATDFSAEILGALRGKNLVQVASSALPAWQFIVGEDEELACAILALCYCVNKIKKFKKLIP